MGVGLEFFLRLFDCLTNNKVQVGRRYLDISRTPIPVCAGMKCRSVGYLYFEALHMFL